MTDPTALETVVATRFSYFGNSGWKIPRDEQEAVLFNPENLRTRLNLFEKINLASLRHQTSRDFHHYVLTSENLPDWASDRLRSICEAAYPEGNVTIDARPYGNARKYFRHFMTEHCKSDPVLQVVLDDDDGLAIDFMETMRREISMVAPDRDDPEDPVFVSFARGIGLVFRDAEGSPRAYEHTYPFINLGLTMMGQRSGKNIFAIDHLAAPRRRTNALLKGPLMFVRSLHGHNDSRAEVTAQWKEIEHWQDNSDLMKRFPYLVGI